jgi:hypothetical protein
VNLLESILHNIGVLGIGFGVAFLGVGLDRLLHLTGFQFSFPHDGREWTSIFVALAMVGAGLIIAVNVDAASGKLAQLPEKAAVEDAVKSDSQRCKQEYRSPPFNENFANSSRCRPTTGQIELQQMQM